MTPEEQMRFMATQEYARRHGYDLFDLLRQFIEILKDEPPGTDIRAIARTIIERNRQTPGFRRLVQVFIDELNKPTDESESKNEVS